MPTWFGGSARAQLPCGYLQQWCLQWCRASNADWFGARLRAPAYSTVRCSAEGSSRFDTGSILGVLASPRIETEGCGSPGASLSVLASPFIIAGRIARSCVIARALGYFPPVPPSLFDKLRFRAPTSASKAEPQAPSAEQPEGTSQPIASAPPSFRRTVLLSLLLVGSALLLVWHSLRYNFVTDDAYISFVYSRNLVEHGELTFNLGDYVEGYSNFSWTVLLAGLMALGIDPSISSRVLGTLCGVLVLAVVCRLTERVLARPGTPWAALPPAFLAASSGFACWSSGGLETQLFTLLCVSAIERFAAVAELGLPPAIERRRGGQLGGLLALSAMTRPEGLLLTAILGICTLGRNLSKLRSSSRARTSPFLPQAFVLLRPSGSQWAVLFTFLALWAPWFAWRCWYYGWPFPNTYYVKAHGPWQPPGLAHQMWSNGIYYLWVWIRQTGLVWAWPLALIGLLVVKPFTVRFTYTVPMAIFAVAYLGYTASVGGDFMGLHRFIMPVFAIAAIAVTLGAQRLLELPMQSKRWMGRREVMQWVAPVAMLVIFMAFAIQQYRLTEVSLRWGRFEADRGIDTPAYLQVYTGDRAEIGKALKGCLQPDDFSIVGGAGAQPYFGRMRAIDVFGLVSEDVAHREPRIRARAGHTKFASDALLLEKNPTFIFSCYAIHPDPVPPGVPCAAPWLSRGYQLATLHVPTLRQSGTYYSFLVKHSRAFQCPGLQPGPQP